MTGVDVMYQPYAYPAYFPYQRHFADQKFGVQKMQEPLDSVNYSSSTNVPRGKEDDLEKETQPKDTQYLNANCVLLTYFSGDISSVVDEHFSRALSQPSSYSADSSGTKSLSWKDSSPMSQRNFPPSFWNSAYQPPASTLSSTHHDLQFTPDPYIATSIHGLSGLHHQDPWHYTISSQTHGYPHRSMHDFAYSTMATPSRYNPHYGSLLMQPSMSAGRLGGCDMTKPSESWSSRYHPDHRLASEFSSRAHLDSGISGLENPNRRTQQGFILVLIAVSPWQ
ncbi:transcription cofactor vestigial-like protein 2 [Liolophura sinensis]|uniref:transcription cofactor vestigial-like protein 2 n=1 Tax=Liolophura sinensis TaxID=3198878 RepID=UPI00315928E4